MDDRPQLRQKLVPIPSGAEEFLWLLSFFEKTSVLYSYMLVLSMYIRTCSDQLRLLMVYCVILKDEYTACPTEFCAFHYSNLGRGTFVILKSYF